MDLGIEGRIALVTGGSRGIGLAIAEALAREGAKLFLCARNDSALKAACDRLPPAAEAAFAAADLSRADDCTRAFESCVRAFGRVDILVNNAASTSGGKAGFLGLDDGDWLATWQGTLMSAVRLSRLAVPGMVERRWGRIVMIASTSAREPDVVVPHYNAAKAAMVNLSKTLANAYAAEQVLVNCICPGVVRTAAVEAAARRRLAEQGVATEAMSAEEAVRRYFGPRRPIPVGRIGAPTDVAGMVALLCSEHASWITGATIDVDGGWVKAVF